MTLSFAKKNGQRHRRREHRQPGPHRIPALSSPTNTMADVRENARCHMPDRTPVKLPDKQPARPD